MHLPPELWLVIVESLREDLRSLSCLSRISKQFLHFSLPVLYGDIALSSPRLMSSFFDAVVTSPRQIGQFVQKLCLGSNIGCDHFSWPRVHKGLALQLRAALKMLPNLQSLMLFITQAAFNICFDQLEVPFMLKGLSIPCFHSNPFYQLLSSQRSIILLGLVGHNSTDHLQEYITNNPNILPCLLGFMGPQKIGDVLNQRTSIIANKNAGALL